MPNWNENELTITGPDVNKVLETIRSQSGEDEDVRILDFNTIIPYPQIYRDMDKRAEQYREKLNAIANDDPQRKQKLEALGAEYGVEPGAPWIKDGYNSGGYEWCCDFWQTKWNACHVHLTTRADSSKPLRKTSKCAYCQTVHKTETMVVLTCQQCGSPLPDAEPIQAFLEFDTAWSPPIPVVERLASMFPDHTFELKYFEGGMGFSGHARWSEGIEEFHHQYDYDGPARRINPIHNYKEQSMSHHSEHQKMKPVLDLARKLDIATNPHSAAIFEAGSGGFQVWCTPKDHPKGWDGIVMNPGVFSKPCEYVGSVNWKWEEDAIVGLEIETSAYALADQKPDEYCNLTDIPRDFHRRTIFNRDADIEWLKEKITWLFGEAGVSLPPFEYKQAALSEIGPYILAHYTSDSDEYVVIVSPELDPQEFCKPGYEVARTLPIWKAGDFPADVILRPDHEYQEADIEPDEGPLVEQYENASRLGDDGWLEAAMEDSISGWDE